MTTVPEASVRQFATDGYFVLPPVMAPEDLAAMRAACDGLIAEYDASTAVEDADVADPAQRRRRTADGRLIRDNIITQAGARYFLQGRHAESAAMLRFLHGDLIWAICVATLGPDAYLYNEQFVVKKPDAATDFSWHQDSGYVPFAHRPYVTAWFALDDATEANGALRVLPYARAGTRDRVEHVRIAGSNDAVGYAGDDPGDLVAVPAGGAVVFSSTLFHRSGPNRSDAPRRAYIAQFTAAPFMTEDGRALRHFARPILQDGRPAPAASQGRDQAIQNQGTEETT